MKVRRAGHVACTGLTKDKKKLRWHICSDLCLQARKRKWISKRENARVWSALSDWGQRPVPAVVSMGMNFCFPRFDVIPQLDVRKLSS